MRHLLAAVTLATLLASPGPASADTQGGLRGTPAPRAACTWVSTSVAEQPATGKVKSIQVCQLSATGMTVKTPVTVSATTQAAAYRALLDALKQPDGAALGGTFCPMYADMLRIVYVTTTTGTWRAHLPVDGCRHYTPAVRAALAAVR